MLYYSLRKYDICYEKTCFEKHDAKCIMKDFRKYSLIAKINITEKSWYKSGFDENMSIYIYI